MVRAKTIFDEEDKKAVQHFLLDIDGLQRIERDIESKLLPVNVFDVLGIAEYEIRHSNLLAWLLDPNGSHGAGDWFLKHFLLKALCDDLDIDKSVRNFLYTLNGKYLCRVEREWNHIDILITIEPLWNGHRKKYIVAIENKINASEGDGQLQKYHQVLDAHYKDEDFVKFFIFLTPEGRPPEDEAENKDWCPVSYQVVASELKQIRESQNLFRKETDAIIEQYLEVLKMRVVNDGELERTILAIYERHKRALDLIYDYASPSSRVDRILKDVLKELAQENDALIYFDESKSNRGYVRFNFKVERDVFLDEAGDAWGKGRRTFFEIVTRGTSLNIKWTLSPHNASHKTISKMQKVVDSLADGKKERKVVSCNQKWRTVWSCRIMEKAQYEKCCLDSDEELAERLKKLISEFIEGGSKKKSSDPIVKILKKLFKGKKETGNE